VVRAMGATANRKSPPGADNIPVEEVSGQWIECIRYVLLCGKLETGWKTGLNLYLYHYLRTLPNASKKCTNYRTIALVSHASKP